jgi:hypothetical protein
MHRISNIKREYICLSDYVPRICGKIHLEKFYSYIPSFKALSMTLLKEKRQIKYNWLSSTKYSWIFFNNLSCIELQNS